MTLSNTPLQSPAYVEAHPACGSACSQNKGASRWDGRCSCESEQELNQSCRSFNSLLYLSPPRIRCSEGSPAPSTEGSPEEARGRVVRELLKLVDDESPPLKIQTRLQQKPLQDLTNRPKDELKTQQKLPFAFPDGGWVCSACSNYNFAGRVKCNRCGKQKGQDDSNGKPRHLQRLEQFGSCSHDENQPLQRDSETVPRSSKKRPRPPQERVGDWVCAACQNLNFAFRKECNRCKLVKDPLFTPSAFPQTPSCSFSGPLFPLSPYYQQPGLVQYGDYGFAVPIDYYSLVMNYSTMPYM